MRNKNIMSSLTGGTKIFLLICLALTLVTDFAVTVMLGVQGLAGTSYFTYPLFLTIADALFLLVAVVSNFRFAYTIKHLVIYLVVSTLFLLCTVIFNISGGQIVYTDLAAALWTTVHALSVAGALGCYLYAAKRIRSGRGAQTVIISVFTAAYIGLIVFYAVSLFGSGYFGQGGATRALIYGYDEVTDTYEVTGVLDGNSDQVYVPEEFNGKKISKVSSDVFTARGVNSVSLFCSPDVEFTGNFEFYPYGTAADTVYTTKANSDAFRQKFYDEYNKENWATLALELANAVVPGDLTEDEVFITFAYDEENYEFVKHNPLRTWIGKKGDRFDPSYFDDIPYAKYSDRKNDAHLLWNFENNGKYILSDMYYSPVVNTRQTISDTELAERRLLNGSTITENIAAVNVSFERIYKIYPGESNDELHPTEREFAPSVVNGEKLGYKLTVNEYADEILQNFERNGFGVEMWYSTGSRPMQRNRFDSLTESVLHYWRDEAEFTIYPEWYFKTPEVTLTSNCENNTIIYGENLSLNTSVKSEVDGVYYEYGWTRNGYTIEGETSGSLSKERISRDEEGTYEVLVTARSTESSLYERVYQGLYITIDQRPIEVIWTLPSDRVFSGEDKTAYCEIKTDNVLNGDNVELSKNSFSYYPAGEHTFTASLSYGSYNYAITNATRSFTIEKAPLDVVWSNEDLTYNRAAQSPTVGFSGFKGTADSVYPSCSTFTSAGWHTFTVTATGSDAGNYYLTNNTKLLEIKPYGVTVSWSINGGDNIYYNGDPYTVTARATGLSSENIAVNLSRSTITDAGTYEITATLANSNYTVAEGATHTFVINPRTVKVNWNRGVTGLDGKYHLTYNGAVQMPAYSITGPKGEQLNAEIKLTGVGNGKDVGNYSCTAELLPSSLYNVNNYVLDSSKDCEYEIQQLVVNVEWGETRLEYNGKPQVPEAHITGAGNDGIITLVVKSDFSNHTEVGNYSAIVQAEDQTNPVLKNYSMHNNATHYEIVKRTLVYRAADVTVTEGDPLPQLSYIPPNGHISGEDIGIIVSDVQVSVEGYPVSAGRYVNFIIITGKVTGDKKDNFEVKFEYGTLTVLPKGGN